MAGLVVIGPETVESLDLGQHGAVAEGDGLGGDGGARRELHQTQVVCRECCCYFREIDRALHRRQGVEGLAAMARSGFGDRRPENAPDPWLGEHQNRSRCFEHGGGPLVVLLDAAEPYRGIEWHRHRAGGEDAKEGFEELRTGRVDEGHPLPRGDPEGPEPGGGPTRAASNLVPAEPGLALAPIEQPKARVGMVTSSIEQPDQCVRTAADRPRHGGCYFRSLAGQRQRLRPRTMPGAMEFDPAGAFWSPVRGDTEKPGA